MSNPVAMFTEPAVPDAWHTVTAPGGYEWWYFDAEQGEDDIRIVAILFQGFVFHPGYLREYARFLKTPTRTAPPLPADFPCAYFIVYRGDKIVSQFMTQHAPVDFSASSERVEARVGPNRMSQRADGSIELELRGMPWELTGRGPQTFKDQLLSGRLVFRPQFPAPPLQRRFFAREWSGADHHWVIANPLCQVSGEIELSGAGKPWKMSFAGRGYHDHNFGTGPIGPRLSRWMWGRVLLDRQATAFHWAMPRGGFHEELHLVEADEMGLRELPADRLQAGWNGRTSTLLKYPTWLDVGPLRLRRPVVIDATPFYLRLAYDATLRGVPATAFCEIAYPHRLRWPLLGRMIEMSINKQVVGQSATKSPQV